MNLRVKCKLNAYHLATREELFTKGKEYLAMVDGKGTEIIAIDNFGNHTTISRAFGNESIYDNEVFKTHFKTSGFAIEMHYKKYAQ